MAPDTDPSPSILSRVSRFPADLTAVVALSVLVTGASFLPLVRDSPARTFVFPILFFVPGYAVISSLFPEKRTAGSEPPAHGRGLSAPKRIALSFVTSLVIVPLLGLVLSFSPLGLQLHWLATSVTVLVAVFVAIAYRRRTRLDTDRRLGVQWRERFLTARQELFDDEPLPARAVNVLLLFVVLASIGTIGYAVGVPQQGDSFTELYILTESDSGQLTADNYPTDFAPGERAELVLGIKNHEYETIDYTVLVEIHDVAVENDSTRILDREELQRFEPTLTHNETWRQRHTIIPRMTGNRLRLTYLLYRGPSPETPTTDNAYREVHIWVNVSSTSRPRSEYTPPVTV